VNLSNSLILLVVAIVLLWLAVTDKLTRVLDAYDVIVGKKTASASTSFLSSSLSLPSITPTINVSLPSLPALGTNPQVDV
jgi:hypothetical protein